MTFNLTAEDLAAMHGLLPDHPALSALSRAAGDAASADPYCGTCSGYGAVKLPVAGEVEDFVCPVCRPWVKGFPGMTSPDGWTIPPYGAGETLSAPTGSEFF